MLGFLPEMLRTCGSKMNYQNLYFTSQLQMLRSLMISIYSQKQKSRNYQKKRATRLRRSVGKINRNLRHFTKIRFGSGARSTHHRFGTPPPWRWKKKNGGKRVFMLTKIWDAFRRNRRKRGQNHAQRPDVDSQRVPFGLLVMRGNNLWREIGGGSAESAHNLFILHVPLLTRSRVFRFCSWRI